MPFINCDPELVVQNIKTLCKQNKIAIPKMWADVFGIQKNIYRLKDHPLTAQELQQIADYFNITIDDLTQKQLGSTLQEAETFYKNFSYQCKIHNLPIRNADVTIFGHRKNMYQWQYTLPNKQIIEQIADYFHIPVEKLIAPQFYPEEIKEEIQDETEKQPELKILFRNAPNLTTDNLNTINDMVSFLLDKQKKQNNDH